MTQFVVQGILFDLDGTLVDSTGSVERNWHRLAQGIGASWDEIGGWIHGIPVRQVLRRLRPDMPDDQVSHWEQFMIEGESTDTGDVVAQPGAVSALDLLPTARWAVVTSGSLRLATARLSAAGLPLPRHLVTADDVAIGKPDPAPFLLGARRLGLAPADCLAVEDAPPGVESALAAGCRVLGVATTHADLATAVPAAVAVVRDLSAVAFSADRAGVIVTW